MTCKRKLLYVGEVQSGTTCAMRATALRSLGYDVETVSVVPAVRPPLWKLLLGKLGNRLRRPIDLNGVNAAILAKSSSCDVLWIDKGNLVKPATLMQVRSMHPRPTVVGFSPDDMEQRHCTSVTFHATLPLYDAFITTKSYNVAELGRRGCQCVIFADNGYDPATHRPVEVAEDLRLARSMSIVFIGYHELARQRSIAAVAGAGFRVDVYGPGWAAVRRRLPETVTVYPAIYGDDYAHTICSYPIALGFLRRCNRDLQTTRSVEIPACGCFMLAERTGEHERLFREGVEAEYFQDDVELVSKAAYYLAHPDKRAMIAARGRARCIDGGYAYAQRLEAAMRTIAQRASGGLGPSPQIHR